MARKRFSAEQIIAKLREADAMLSGGASVGQVCPRLEVSEQTLSRWRSRYDGMKSGEARRFKELEQENARLKRIVADQALVGHHAAQGPERGKMVRPTRRREAVAYPREACYHARFAASTAYPFG